MLTQNYFDLFGMPVSFKPDLSVLKSKYYALSRTFHPDFYTLESATKQEEMMTRSGLVNTAYKVLSDDKSRMAYILELHNLLGKEENQILEPSFLMEMMEINETIFDLQMEFDISAYDTVVSKVKAVEESLVQEVNRHIFNFEQGQDLELNLLKIRDYFLKSKYLLRIRENISTFAHLNGKTSQ
ncbi:MAG: Fe-S protein assembly co-chaperone HscB [Saprospiraceae bacterium]|nr:Fe-S protein assembly co-chaperone HscB [Saprospiraceae bacterium]